ncbi:(2Fe-2S)-binding protein [Pseudonocardia adelaidensis]|uniref:(2Fe-2S)-binding protein n=1 Tax=Pseudonocardia adelaidensis TaxID=648754 RepID=A0ABP9NA27_9PSEU
MRRLIGRRQRGAAVSPASSELDVNGDVRQVVHAPDATLLTLLRDDLGLRGAKLGCGSGECGACTVLVDGVPVMACVTLASRVRGRVETIEGLREETATLRAAFAVEGAFQCGFCTPGHVVRLAAMLRDGDVPADDAELRHRMAGNICRCTGYAAIVRAVRAAAGGEQDGEQRG